MSTVLLWGLSRAETRSAELVSPGLGSRVLGKCAQVRPRRPLGKRRADMGPTDAGRPFSAWPWAGGLERRRIVSGTSAMGDIDGRTKRSSAFPRSIKFLGPSALLLVARLRLSPVAGLG